MRFSHVLVMSLASVLFMQQLGLQAQEAATETTTATEEATVEKKETAEDVFKKGLSLGRTKLPEGLTDEEKQEFIANILQEMLATFDQALTMEPEQNLRRQIMSQKFNILSSLTSREVDGAYEQTEKFIEAAKADEDEKLAAQAKGWETSFEFVRIRRLEPAEQLKRLNEMKDEIIASEPTIQSYSQARQLLSNASSMLESEQEISFYQDFSEFFGKSDDEKVVEAAKSFDGIIRRLSLPGHPIEVDGTTVAGEGFNIDSLKGKVVLVDFWATWCGPCIAEFPNMRKLYEIYHPHGFEIVGISLDKDADKLNSFLENGNVPWIVLHDANTEKGWDHPVATKYGINAIPCMILVGADGKVVSITARGHMLKELLAELYPNVEVPAETASTEKENKPAEES